MTENSWNRVDSKITIPEPPVSAPEVAFVANFDDDLFTSELDRIDAARRLYGLLTADEALGNPDKTNSAAYTQAREDLEKSLLLVKGSPVLLKFTPLSDAVTDNKGSDILLRAFDIYNVLVDTSATFPSEDRVNEIVEKIESKARPVTRASIETFLNEEHLQKDVTKPREASVRIYEERVHSLAEVQRYERSLSEASRISYRAIVDEIFKQGGTITDLAAIIEGESNKSTNENARFVRINTETLAYLTMLQQRHSHQDTPVLGSSSVQEKNENRNLAVPKGFLGNFIDRSGLVLAEEQNTSVLTNPATGQIVSILPWSPKDIAILAQPYEQGESPTF